MYKNLSSYVIYAIFIAGLYIIYMLILRGGTLPSLLFALLPAIGICIAGIFKGAYSYYAFFIINYFIMGVSRYVPIKPGMIMLGLSFGLILVVFLKNIFHPYAWKDSRNFLTGMWTIWFIYCFFELFNPNALWAPWTIAFPNYAFYPLLCAIIVPIFFSKYKNFQWLLVVWAILTLLAAAKGYWQRNRGFDSPELHWLYAEGGARTHFLHTGIRYFSFFSDAAAYGTSMGASLLIFGISGFYVKKYWQKGLFWISAISGGYGLMISGTRSVLAIPLVGLAIFLILCKNFKAALISGIVLVGTFVFLNYTDIGADNRYIRRMRTAFDQNDASWNVRVSNREVIYKLMKNKPFGTGLGLAGAKAKRFRTINEHDPLTYIATDSWFIMTYVESGIIGLTIYLTVLLLIIFRGTYIAFFKIKNRQLRGQLFAIIATIAGILVVCYANEILNYPNGIILYTLMALLFIAPLYDKELQQHETNS